MQGCVAATGGGCFTVLLRRAFSIAWGHFLCGLYDCGFCFALNYDVGRVVTRLLNSLPVHVELSPPKSLI